MDANAVGCQYAAHRMAILRHYEDIVEAFEPRSITITDVEEVVYDAFFFLDQQPDKAHDVDYHGIDIFRRIDYKEEDLKKLQENQFNMVRDLWDELLGGTIFVYEDHGLGYEACVVRRFQRDIVAITRPERYQGKDRMFEDFINSRKRNDLFPRDGQRLSQILKRAEAKQLGAAQLRDSLGQWVALLHDGMKTELCFLWHVKEGVRLLYREAVQEAMWREFRVFNINQPYRRREMHVENRQQQPRFKWWMETVYGLVQVKSEPPEPPPRRVRFADNPIATEEHPPASNRNVRQDAAQSNSPLFGYVESDSDDEDEDFEEPPERSRERSGTDRGGPRLPKSLWEDKIRQRWAEKVKQGGDEIQVYRNWLTSSKCRCCWVLNFGMHCISNRTKKSCINCTRKGVPCEIVEPQGSKFKVVTLAQERNPGNHFKDYYAFICDKNTKHEQTLMREHYNHRSRCLQCAVSGGCGQGKCRRQELAKSDLFDYKTSNLVACDSCQEKKDKGRDDFRCMVVIEKKRTGESEATLKLLQLPWSHEKGRQQPALTQPLYTPNRTSTARRVTQHQDKRVDIPEGRRSRSPKRNSDNDLPRNARPPDRSLSDLRERAKQYYQSRGGDNPDLAHRRRRG